MAERKVPLTADRLQNAAELGAYLREVRLAAGLSQAEVARRSGILRVNIARLERGLRLPRVETLFTLAAALGARLEIALILGEGGHE